MKTIMKKLRRFTVIPALATVLILSAAGVVEADGGDIRFEYHLGDAFFGCAELLPTDPPIPAVPGSPSCRPEAVAEDLNGNFPGQGGSIAIQGHGELEVDKRGRPEDVNGGGLFAQFDEFGNPISSGTWKARRLLSFDAYGEDDVTPLPDGFESGRALILIRLKPKGGKRVDAVLEIGCRLPGNMGIFGTIEGARVFVDGGLNYNIAADPKLTLFVNLGSDDDDDDSDSD